MYSPCERAERQLGCRRGLSETTIRFSTTSADGTSTPGALFQRVRGWCDRTRSAGRKSFLSRHPTKPYLASIPIHFQTFLKARDSAEPGCRRGRDPNVTSGRREYAPQKRAIATTRSPSRRTSCGYGQIGWYHEHSSRPFLGMGAFLWSARRRLERP